MKKTFWLSLVILAASLADLYAEDSADSLSAQVSADTVSAQPAENAGTLSQPQRIIQKPVTPASVKTDSLVITDKKDLTYLGKIVKRELKSRDSVVLNREIIRGASVRYRYEIILNGESLWDLTLTSPTEDLEQIFVKAVHNKKIEIGKQQVKERQRGSFSATPWLSVPPIFAEKGLPKKMLDWTAWKSGGEINFYRHHLYNFRKAAGDTAENLVNLAKPVLYDHRMDMSYVHRFGYFWVGAGIERSWQNSSRFDTLFEDRGGFFARMTGSLQVAVPGFRYKIYGDPGLIPFYGQYEDSLYSKMYPNAKYQYLKKLNITKDRVKVEVERQFGMKDTIEVNRIQPLGGAAHELTFKVGYLQYCLNIHPRAYTAPVQTIGMVGMPFFKGDWDMKMIILPNGKIVPHAAADFYRTSIKIGENVLGISPVHFEVEVWQGKDFFASLGFNAEFITKKASFYKE